MIKRRIFDEVLKWIDEDRIIIIKGARQTGKTTLLKYLMNYLENSHKRVIYFSIDNEIYNPAFENPNLLIKYLKSQYEITKNEKMILILDEFQYLRDPGLFLKVLYDNYKDMFKIIVSGSSSLELSKTREFLTGRKIEFVLERFDFLEFLIAKSKNKYDFSFKLNQSNDINDFIKIYKEDLKNNLLEYINFGGYPEIVLTENIEKKRLKLKEIVNTYIKKDVVDYLKVENISGFNNLVSILFSSTGSMLNKDELSNTVGLNIRTTNKYLDILQNTFILTYLSPFYKNIRKEVSKMKKVYSNDLSFNTLYSGLMYDKFDLISGNIIENFVFLVLKDFDYLYYYRTKTKAEIDFILKINNELIPIEVKFTNRIKYNSRILKYFEKNYNAKFSIIITKDEYFVKDKVFFVPVFLLPFIEFI